MKIRKLSELGDFKNGLNFSKEEAAGTGCKFIGVGNFGNRTYPSYENLEEINEDLVTEADLLQENDILFVRSNGNKALVGRSMFIKSIKENVAYSGFCIRFRPNPLEIDATYLFYVLRSPYCRKQYTPSPQTNITNLSQDMLGNVKVPVFDDIDEEKKYAVLFDLIDGKIDLNQKLCDSMESMAKTLYDYWFVQFDFPDENGKPYRASDGKMVWNEQLKREIPDGWDVGDLSDIANITMGQSPEGTSYNENGIGKVFYQGRTDFGTRFPTPRMYTTAPTRFAKKNDILLSVRAPVGDLNVAMEECCIGRGLAALNSKLGSQLHLMYTLMGFKKFFDVMDGNGTTFGSITKDDLFELKVAIPPAPLLKRFEEAVSPTENRIRTSETENRELAHLRDWLLPMLMNGQATVMDEPPAEQVLSFPQKQPQQFTVKQAARSYSPNEERKDDTADLLRFYMERKK